MLRSGFRQMMPSLGLLVLLVTITVDVSVSEELEEVQLLYSSAFPLHDAESNGSQEPTNLPSESLNDPPTLIVQQPSLPPDTTTRSDEDILVENIVKLIQSISTSSAVEGDDPPDFRQTSREARQMNLGATGRLRSLFNIPFNHGQGFIPRTPLGGNIFYGANPSGWQQRFMNTFSNIFSFGRPNQMLPYGGISQAASTNNPSFTPYPHGGHAMYNPYSQPPHAPNMWNQFQHAPVPQHGEDLSNAASFGHQMRLQLGNTFNPQNYGPFPQQQYQYGPDLATSGSGMFPHQAMPVGNPHPNFGQYVASVPRHKPLFQNVNGLKGASLEMSNAFADFADSHEHGPEVTQKFGSVGHTINTFLGMMGLGSSGGLTSDDVGGYGGGGDYASMDSTPISRSMDFYPGYGNQAVLDEMEDFPIFQEDITKDYLTRMNLTHLLDHVSIYEKDESTNNSDGEVHILEITAKDPETGEEMSPKYIVSGIDTGKFHSPPSQKTLYNLIKGTKSPTDPLEVPAEHSDKPKVAETQDKDENNSYKEDGPKITSIFSSSITYSIPDGKKPWLLDLKKKPSGEYEKESLSENPELPSNQDKTKDKKESAVSPSVNYKIPPTHSPVAVKDRIPPVAVFQGFPAKSDAKAPEPPKYAPTQSPPKYAPAHSLPHNHESEENINGLIDDHIVRSWVPVSSGPGYTEKRPKPIYEINSDEIPKGLSVVHQMLSGMESLQE